MYILIFYVIDLFLFCYLFYFSSGLCIICYALVSVCWSEGIGVREGMWNIVRMSWESHQLRWPPSIPTSCQPILLS